MLVRTIAAAVAMFAALLMGASIASAAPAKYTHAQATAQLRAAGITWSSSGGCSDRNRSNCTSFDQINKTTIAGIKTFKSASGCAVNISGGTETGHASGQYSHWNGYKVDISLSGCVTNYIKSKFASIGGNKWKSNAGNIYYLESNHWDITYHSAG